MQEMEQWIRDYDRRKTDFYGESKKALLSSRFDLSSMSWDEIREIPIPELGEDMNLGKSFEALRKTWWSWKRSRAEGLQDTEAAFRILKIQFVLGLPLSEFEGINPEWVEAELSNEWDKMSHDYYGEEMSEEDRQLVRD